MPESVRRSWGNDAMKKDLFDLTGRTVIVTGGAGYLGTAMCEGLAQYGASVVVASRDVAKCNRLADRLRKDYGCDALAVGFDMTEVASVKELMSTTHARFGRIDVLVNNANASTPGYIEDVDYEKWQLGLDGSINAVYKCIRETLPYMEAQGSGRIINIASMYGLLAPNPSIYGGQAKLNSPPNYGTGKAAILQLTRYIAAYYGKKGILANAVCPGSFPQPMTQENQAFVGLLSEKTMLGRIGVPEELKGIVVYLASDASSYMTGQSLSVDGGVTAW
jgi:gluconate 5-dehydrogenase